MSRSTTPLLKEHRVFANPTEPLPLGEGEEILTFQMGPTSGNDNLFLKEYQLPMGEALLD